MLAIFCFGISVLFLAGALIIPETKDNLEISRRHSDELLGALVFLMFSTR